MTSTTPPAEPTAVGAGTAPTASPRDATPPSGKRRSTRPRAARRAVDLSVDSRDESGPHPEPHPEPLVSHGADVSDAERIQHVQSPTWIGYTRANHILERMQDLLLHPPSGRMPNLLVVGESGNGKTQIISRFVRKHAAYDHPTRTAAAVPVVSILAPPVPDESRLYSAIIDYVHAPQRASDRAEAKYRQVVHLMRELGVRLLIIDEIQQILTGPPVKQRIFLNVIKHVGNELQIPIVGAGTEDAFHAIQSEPQLARRFMPMPLSRWTPGQDYLRLLASFEARLPLRKRSPLTDPAVSERILTMSEGTIGEIAGVIATAAVAAIRTGHECIDTAVLDDLDWTAPSARKWHLEV